MSAESNELEQARAAGQVIAERLKTDETYAQRLRENPAQALLEAGMPPALLGAALQELGASEEEVQGYLRAVLSAGPATAGASVDLSLGMLSRQTDVSHRFGCLISHLPPSSSSGGEILGKLGRL